MGLGSKCVEQFGQRFVWPRQHRWSSWSRWLRSSRCSIWLRSPRWSRWPRLTTVFFISHLSTILGFLLGADTLFGKHSETKNPKKSQNIFPWKVDRWLVRGNWGEASMDKVPPSGERKSNIEAADLSPRRSLATIFRKKNCNWSQAVCWWPYSIVLLFIYDISTSFLLPFFRIEKSYDDKVHKVFFAALLTWLLSNIS